MFRILTYNVHSCIGSDRKCDPARIAAVIAECRPDIIALQELDVRRARTGGVDQAHAIALHLGMDFHFHAALHVEEEQYGDAILTALPARLVKAGPLPSIGEPRGAIWVAVEVDGVEFQIVNTHFGVRRTQRLEHASTLLGPGWLGDPACRPLVLLGDFNAVPRSVPYRKFAERLKDVQVGARRPHRPVPTYPTLFPFLRIDHIFVDNLIEVANAKVHSSRLARAASDHLPLFAELRLAHNAVKTYVPSGQ